MENYKGEPRLLWEKKVGDKDTWVSSVSFLLPTPDADPSTSQILYSATGHLMLRSVKNGRPLTMSLDTTELVLLEYISLSRDQRTLAVTGGLNSGVWWWCTFSRQEDGSWDQGSTHSLSYWPADVTWTTDGDVVIAGCDGELEKFSTDGRQVWARTKEQTQLSEARSVAVCDQDGLYVSDVLSNCVRVYSSSSGKLQDSISLPDQVIRNPSGICVTPRGTVFMGCLYRSDWAVSMRLPGDTQWLPIITKLPDVAMSLAISGHHLSVGILGNPIRLYEVT